MNKRKQTWRAAVSAATPRRGSLLYNIRTLLAAGAAAMAVALPAFADMTVDENMTLDADADWSDQGTVIIAQGATVDLNGHTLKVKGLHCNGSIVDGSAIPGYALLDYIESSGTQWINTGFTTTAENGSRAFFMTRTFSHSSNIMSIPAMISGNALFLNRSSSR